jgi:hypothetical protein
MRLPTTPRSTLAALLRAGDEIAFHKIDRMGRLRTEAAYLDADLNDSVHWVAVHSVEPDEVKDRVVNIRHTLGELTLRENERVIMREVIRLDPWSYVIPAESAVS